MICSPAPRLVVHPGPTIRRHPTPMTVAIRRPVGVLARGVSIRPPYISVLSRVYPFTVIVEVFGTVDVLVVIFVVVGVFQTLCNCHIAVQRPRIKLVCITFRVGRFPFARKLPVNFYICRPSVFKSKARIIGVNAGLTIICDANADFAVTLFTGIDAIHPRSLHGNCCFGSIDLKERAVLIEPRQPRT